MAPIMNLVNGLLLRTHQAAASGAGSEHVRQEAIEYLETFRSEAARSLDQIARRAVGMLEPDCRVFTLSGSETVVRTLEEAHRLGLLREVVVAESRPMMEGKQLARRLGASGVATTLVVDAATALYVRRCDVVLVGADAVGSTSFVNKIGTWCAIRAAREAGRVRYALAAESKLVPSDWPFPSCEGEAREVSAEHWANVTPRNPYFETVPLHELTGVVTESGVYSGPALALRTAQLEICPLLRPVLSRLVDDGRAVATAERGSRLSGG